MEQNLQILQLPVSIRKINPTCWHRNKGKVEYICMLYLLISIVEVHGGWYVMCAKSVAVTSCVRIVLTRILYISVFR